MPTVVMASQATFNQSDYGWVRKQDSTVYPPNTTAQAISYDTDFIIRRSKYYAGGWYYDISLTLVTFNTASLPDNATITSATLTFPKPYTLTDGGLNLVGEYYAWSSSVQASDYTEYATGTSAFSYAIASISTSASTDISLSNVGNINKTGYTGFRFGMSNATPTNDNYLIYHNGSGYSRSITLIVNYTTGYSKEINGITSAAEVNGVAVPSEVNGL